jgi:pyrroloquinoline quinone biosynthesis protein D
MITIADVTRPRLADKARLKWDAIREKHLLLFPEGVLILNQTAYDILALCDGQRDVAKIVAALGEKYQNPSIDGDVKEVLRRLVEKKYVAMDG